MKRKHGLKLAIIIFFIAFLVYVAFNGLLINWTSYLDGADEVRLGIDLKGGMYAYMQPEEGVTATREELDTAKGIIETRLDGSGIYDRTIMPDYTNNRIIVELPWQKGETSFNPEKIVDEIGQIAQLTFRAVNEDERDEYGNYLPSEPVLVDGKDVDDAYATINPETGKWIIALKFNKKGTDDFAKATRSLKNEKLGIFLDTTCISAPTVENVITTGDAIITGEFTRQEAESLASRIKSGKLPFAMKASQVQSITPILGQNALDISVQAGFYALLIVFAFMIIYYRIPGIIAGIALIGNLCLQVLFISWTGIVLTLPGIAGIILSVGMGVDSNIIIFERIKEELNLGKDITTTIEDGFRRAYVAIIDGNVTTLLAAACLYAFGTGPIRGFAVTLSLGVLINVVADVVFTRAMLRNLACLNIIKNYFWFGQKKRKEDVA